MSDEKRVTYFLTDGSVETRVTNGSKTEVIQHRSIKKGRWGRLWGKLKRFFR